MKLLEAIGRKPSTPAPRNAAGMFRYGGIEYPFGSMPGSDPTVADASFASMIRNVHEKSGPVSAAVTTRALLMSEVEFAWKPRFGGSAELSYTPALNLLDAPGPVTRSTMMFRLEQDASYAGNAIVAHRRGTRSVFRLEPHRVTFAFGSNSEPTWDVNGNTILPYDAQVTAVIYNSSTAPGPPDVKHLEVFQVGEFAHWMPEPDPLYWWRGASWIAPLLEDVALDGQISDHQSKFFEHAATPNLVFVMDPARTEDEVQAYADIVNDKHSGGRNAYKNMFLGGAVDVKTVGADLSKLSLKDLQGGLETRVSTRSRVPAVILGIREGLSGSSLNTGNYSAARRLLADGWFSPTVKGLCQTLEALVPPPAGKRLAHDPSRVLFLQEDRKDEAEINGVKVTAIRTLVDGGFDPNTAVATIAPEWAGKLDHAGLLSVQLQEPGATNADARTVMGRLGRVADVDTLDLTALLDGLDEPTTKTVHAVLVSTEALDMQTLRAEMKAALTGATDEA